MERRAHSNANANEGAPDEDGDLGSGGSSVTRGDASVKGGSSLVASGTSARSRRDGEVWSWHRNGPRISGLAGESRGTAVLETDGLRVLRH